MCRGWRLALGILMLVAPVALRAQVTPTQAANDEAAKNAQKARAVLDAMVTALGGDAWLNMKNRMLQGHIAAFFHGQPDVGTTEIWEYHEWPDHDRIEVTKHRDVDEFFIGRQGWEVTYKGKAPLPQEQVDDFLRRRDHSIETAVKVWMKDPNTILVYEGQHMAERHLAEQVTLISAQNEAVTIMVDAQSHLPLRRTFEWRDPVYKDKNTDTEEYDDYHVMEGFPTPLSISRLKNEEMVRQFFVVKAAYNQQLPGDFWDMDTVARKVKR